MTDHAEGRDEPLTVAALAIQVSRLLAHLESLTAQLRDLTSSAQARRSPTSSKLNQKIGQILTALETDNNASPATWHWLTMTDH